MRSGVATRERCTVVQTTGDFREGFTLTLQKPGKTPSHLQARTVLCAAGRQWQPRRPQGVAHVHRKSRFVGLKTHIQGVPLHRHVELHTDRPGYCGMEEVADGVTNLCCWVGVEALRRAGGTPHRFLASALRENPHLGIRLQGVKPAGMSWTTTSFTYRRGVTPVVSGIWNIGDCAAMAAPLTGDGMGMGLRSAELAATIMLEVFRQELPWSLATAEYMRRWREEFRPLLQWGRGLEALLLRPRLAWLACKALQGVPRLMPQLYGRTRQLGSATGSAVDVE
jgi:2-polyprenyl-6-methoxyphenol hydroxylase-like FAD-dependent oxidoreductase